VEGMGEMPLDQQRIYYCYALFDWCGTPRWIGKGKGKRIDYHEKNSSSNSMKDEFIEQTWIMLEEIPKVKIRENISEAEAFETEVSLIAAIGRYPNGPLTNMDDGGGGISGYRHTRYTKERFSENMKRFFSSMTDEDRRLHMAAATAHITTEMLQDNARRLNEWLIPEQREENARRSNLIYTRERRRKAAALAIAGQTREQLLARAQKSNAKISHEQRVDNGRRAAAKRYANAEPQQWKGRIGWSKKK